MIDGLARRILMVILGVACALPASAQEVARDSITPGMELAVEMGLEYLVAQQHEEGYFEPGPRLAMTGLALMAFLASGHTPDVGRYGAPVRRAIDWMVRIAPEDGYFGRVDGSRMYGHGIATLALAEAYGVDPDPESRRRLREVLVRALKVIVDAQNVPKQPVYAGGWRYEPQSGDADLSLSGWNALSLRAAKNIGLDVPPDAVARAVEFVLRCQVTQEGGFAYQPGQGAVESMTGVGVLNLYLLGGAERPELEPAIAFLRRRPVLESTRFPYYAMYYGAQAAFQVGGDVWQSHWPRYRDLLLNEQLPDGGWPQSRTGEEPGRTYATAMAVLTLSVPFRLLPIYQR